jgi:PAS domain S-box-containing protein
MAMHALGPQAHRVYLGLRDRIVNGDLLPGAKLPAYLALATTFSVAPMTVRLALARLDDDGLILRKPRRGTFVLVQDVTARNQAAAAARDANEWFAKAFQSSPVALSITHLADGRIIDVNEAFERLLGYSREETVGHLAAELGIHAHPEQRAEYVRLLREHSSVHDYELTLRTKAGELRNVLSSMERSELGGEPCIMGSTIDITDRTRAQERLEQREVEVAFLAQASAVLASSLDYETTLRSLAELAVPQIADWCAVHILDGDGSVRELAVAHADPAKLELARELQRRYPPNPDEDSGVYKVVRTLEPEIWPEIPDELLAAAAVDAEHLAMIRELELHSAIVVPLVARGAALGALTLVSAESGRLSGERAVALAQDLASRAAIAIDNARLFRDAHEAQGRLSQLNAELEQRVADRTAQLAVANRELEAFAYSVSHDLRAPLRGLDGFSKILLDRYAQTLDERAQRYLHHIRGSAQDMGRLIDALLRLARIARTDMKSEPVDLSVLAHLVMAQLREQEPEREVGISIADGLVVLGDQQLLRVLLDNLLGNAWKFTRDQAPATIEFGVESQEGENIFTVRDNGVGFDMTYADKLFSPFQRLHSVTEFEGTGIGLATVQRIVHRHGGRIWAEGRVGEGAAFSFTLAGPGGTPS